MQIIEVFKGIFQGEIGLIIACVLIFVAVSDFVIVRFLLWKDIPVDTPQERLENMRSVKKVVYVFVSILLAAGLFGLYVNLV